MEINIRPFNLKKDLERVYKIEVKSLRYPWSKRSFIIALKVGARIDVAEINDVIVGFAVYRIENSMGAVLGHLLNIAVDPEYRAKGIGTLLLKSFERYCKENGAEYAYLEVRASNKGAIQFYKKNNYRIWGIKERYYSNGEDAIVMMKRL